jgi:hypothetical protein
MQLAAGHGRACGGILGKPYMPKPPKETQQQGQNHDFFHGKLLGQNDDSSIAQ